MHPHLAHAIQEIDAAVFNGDVFEDPDERTEMVEYLVRWCKRLEQPFYYNPPFVARLKREITALSNDRNEQKRLADLRGEEVAKWAHESGTAKGQRDRALKLAAFYKSCALSGEVPSAATIAEMEKVPE